MFQDCDISVVDAQRETAANIRVATIFDAAALALFALQCNLDWDEAALKVSPDSCDCWNAWT